jgi:hypothetical protein
MLRFGVSVPNRLGGGTRGVILMYGHRNETAAAANFHVVRSTMNLSDGHQRLAKSISQPCQRTEVFIGHHIRGQMPRGTVPRATKT